ncbi:hypothetical protein ACFX13_014376 [Malus domestica]
MGLQEIREVEDKLTSILGYLFMEELIEQKKSLIGRSNDVVDFEDILCNVAPSVMEKMNSELGRPISDEEVKCAVFQMHPTKAPVPDGRLISDNYLVASEVAHYMHKRVSRLNGHMALKLDISKAYDRLEWKFLEVIMRSMGFSPRWIHMIMMCVSTVTYSFKLNGDPVGKSKNEAFPHVKDRLWKKLQGVGLVELPESGDAYKDNGSSARYFPNTEFLNALINANGSYVWRSIANARQVIVKGHRWQVGDGENINIWHDNWLPRDSYFKVLSHLPVNWDNEATVDKLIVSHSWQWNVKLLQKEIVSADRDSVSISASLPNDVTTAIQSSSSGSELCLMVFSMLWKNMNYVSKLGVGWVKCNFDDAWVQHEMRGGYGVVLQNHEGDLIVVATGFSGSGMTSSTFEAELFTAR